MLSENIITSNPRNISDITVIPDGIITECGLNYEYVFNSEYFKIIKFGGVYYYRCVKCQGWIEGMTRINNREIGNNTHIDHYCIRCHEIIYSRKV